MSRHGPEMWTGVDSAPQPPCANLHVLLQTCESVLLADREDWITRSFADPCSPGLRFPQHNAHQQSAHVVHDGASTITAASVNRPDSTFLRRTQHATSHVSRRSSSNTPGGRTCKIKNASSDINTPLRSSLTWHHRSAPQVETGSKSWVLYFCATPHTWSSFTICINVTDMYTSSNMEYLPRRGAREGL